MRLPTFLLLSSLALAAPTITMADSATPSAGNAAVATADQGAGDHVPGDRERGDRGPGDRDWGKHHRLSAETLQHLQDGRIAYIVAALDLTAEQKPLWAPVADILRQQATARMQHEKPQGADRPHDLSDMLMHHADRMAARAASDKQLADALKALEAKLTPEQKETLRVAFFASMPHHFGRSTAM